MKPKITREEFVAQWLQGAGASERAFLALGIRLDPQPCDCDLDACQGWAMRLRPRYQLLVPYTIRTAGGEA